MYRAEGVDGAEVVTFIENVADEIAKAGDDVKGKTEMDAVVAYLQVLGTASAPK